MELKCKKEKNMKFNQAISNNLVWEIKSYNNQDLIKHLNHLITIEKSLVMSSILLFQNAIRRQINQ